MKARWWLGLVTLVFGVACAKGTTEFGDDDDGWGGSGGTATSTGTVTSGGTGGVGPAGCGNGVMEDGEACDGTDFGEQSCQTLGYLQGELTCEPATCILDATGCFSQECLNDVKEGDEECDGEDFGGTTCQSLGFSGGTIDCDDTCHITGCANEFSENFESAGLSAGWMSSGSPTWWVTTTTPHQGTYCAESGNIGDNGSTGLSRSVTFSAAGSISFWYRYDTESSCDYLTFSIDGLEQGSWSGSGGWTQATYQVAAGTHTLLWTYTKDYSVSIGLDAVWIDDIVAVNGT